MPHNREEQPFDSELLQRDLQEFIGRVSARFGSAPVKPPPRVKFSWPPHPISYEYHVLASDWTSSSTFECHGETFDLEIARTPFGVFGRCAALWHEDRGETESEMLSNLTRSLEPLFARQFAIARALEQETRFSSEISKLDPFGLIRLLYCEDRDVANSAIEQLERSHFRNLYFPALCDVLFDRRHPWRRSAQWCVLELFEDLPAFIDSAADEALAVLAIKGLLLDAEDDYARTVYKAGVVLGGQIPHRRGGESLLECLDSPSLVGRRSAIHGLFHVVEWLPEMEARVVYALRDHAKAETDPQLSIFAFAIAEDIERGGLDHTPEPTFAFER